VSRRAQTGQEPPATGFEAIVAGVAVALAVAAGVLFGGAWFASRPAGHISSDPAVWWSVAGRLIAQPSDPAAAWGAYASDLPGPIWYWTATGLVLAGAIGLAAGAYRLWRRTAVASERFGVETDARVAKRSDVKPLTVRSALPPTGRFLLGQLAPHGPLLATEDRDRRPMRGSPARRQGSRGSVALIGPTQAGKTVTLASGMVGWDGPIVALSVKRDLYDVTAGARAQRGEIAVFDPGASTGLPTARWTPLRGVTTPSGALRAGRALAAAIPRSGVTGGDYWAQQGESFVSAYMAVAGLSELLPDCRHLTDGEPLTIQRLAAWAFRGAGITDPVINELVRSGLESPNLETVRLAEGAAMKLVALHQEDPRIRSSIYATGRLAFEAWAEPSVEHSASRKARATYRSDELWTRKPRFVDLDWLMGHADDGRANTLYLVAPDTEFKRLAPVLGGLLGDLREQIHAWDIAGRRLPKPLLFVIDEAAQLELQWLPEEVSTIAGLGGLFVTCWQSKAQIDHHYGTLADAVLGGHRSKIIFTGCDDPSTLNWLAKVTGTAHMPRRSWSADVVGGRRTISESAEREDLVGAHIVRQMMPGDAVLLHGTLPPAHLRSVRWWKDKALRKHVAVDTNGRPTPPDVPTCPLSNDPVVPGTEASLDRAAREESLAHLPPAVHRPRVTTVRGRRPESAHSGAAIDEAVDELPENPSAGRCATCNKWIECGEGHVLPYSPSDVLICRTCMDAEPPASV
jgi:type IV secretion system protein VirD4